MKIHISLPVRDEQILSLQIGDTVYLDGIIVTGRDMVHKWLVEKFIHPVIPASADEQKVYRTIQPYLNKGVIFHCGPIVSGLESKEYKVISAGPTTSIRSEPYMSDIMHHFNLKGMIGKGGMGLQTLQACREVPGVYFHAVGGAGALIAQSIRKVIAVYQLEFGVPEAMWVLEVSELPVIVTMDAHGNSLHDSVKLTSSEALLKLNSQSHPN
jgi:fumarate hydratase subunit beta